MAASEAGDGSGLCVVTPSPLYTITVEEGGHGPAVHFHAGGQGFWVARMATLLGEPATLCGPFGGEAGRVLRMLIESERVNVRAVPAPEPTAATSTTDATAGAAWSSRWRAPISLATRSMTSTTPRSRAGCRHASSC